MHHRDYTSSPHYQFNQNQNPTPNPTPTTHPLPNLHASSAPPFSSAPYAPSYPDPPSFPEPSYPEPSYTEPYHPKPPSYPEPPSCPEPPPSHSFNPSIHDHRAPLYPPPPPSLPSNPNPNPPYSAPAHDFDDYGSLNPTRSDSLGNDGVYGKGVSAYEGGKAKPYEARGSAPSASASSGFDDYGRAIGGVVSATSKVVKAVPKVDSGEDMNSGVQKFRVLLLAENSGQSDMDVLCQIGLDGIRMLDPNTSRTLRIYPLENITRCDKFDSFTFVFWSKNSVDIRSRRIRLESNRYTTNTLLDTVTAATIQFKELDGSRRPAESLRTSAQPIEKKRGFGDWMNFVKPAAEEKNHWVPDEAVSKCTSCRVDFGAFIRRHHCRNCGDIFCDKCTRCRTALTSDENAQPVRVCLRCMIEVTVRLRKESLSKHVLLSHEDLAKKLKDELERNKRISGSKPDGSGNRMKEVACPICTVHLQVQVPSSGSQTIECGVCQHQFVVSSR